MRHSPKTSSAAEMLCIYTTILLFKWFCSTTFLYIYFCCLCCCRHIIYFISTVTCTCLEWCKTFAVLQSHFVKTHIYRLDELREKWREEKIFSHESANFFLINYHFSVRNIKVRCCHICWFRLRNKMVKDPFPSHIFLLD